MGTDEICERIEKYKAEGKFDLACEIAEETLWYTTACEIAEEAGLTEKFLELAPKAMEQCESNEWFSRAGKFAEKAGLTEKAEELYVKAKEKEIEKTEYLQKQMKEWKDVGDYKSAAEFAESLGLVDKAEELHLKHIKTYENDENRWHPGGGQAESTPCWFRQKAGYGTAALSALNLDMFEKAIEIWERNDEDIESLCYVLRTAELGKLEEKAQDTRCRIMDLATELIEKEFSEFDEEFKRVYEYSLRHPDDWEGSIPVFAKHYAQSIKLAKACAFITGMDEKIPELDKKADECLEKLYTAKKPDSVEKFVGTFFSTYGPQLLKPLGRKFCIGLDEIYSIMGMSITKKEMQENEQKKKEHFDKVHVEKIRYWEANELFLKAALYAERNIDCVNPTLQEEFKAKAVELYKLHAEDLEKE